MIRRSSRTTSCHLAFLSMVNIDICYAKAKLEFKSNVDFHPLRNYKIVYVLIKELLILVGVLKTSFIKSFAYFLYVD